MYEEEPFWCYFHTSCHLVLNGALFCSISRHHEFPEVNASISVSVKYCEDLETEIEVIRNKPI